MIGWNWSESADRLPVDTVVDLVQDVEEIGLPVVGLPHPALAKQATTPFRGIGGLFYLVPMTIEPQDIIRFHVKDRVICRNAQGQSVFTLSPQELVMLAAKRWIEGVAREGKKDIRGVRIPELRHVVLVVAVRMASNLLNRPSSKQARSINVKAEDSRTWTQTGPTSFAPHFQRCSAYADNAGRIGVVSV